MLGRDDETAAAWLADRGLGEAPRLLSRVQVSDGWERALDRVLGGRLAAVLVESLDELRG